MRGKYPRAAQPTRRSADGAYHNTVRLNEHTDHKLFELCQKAGTTRGEIITALINQVEDVVPPTKGIKVIFKK